MDGLGLVYEKRGNTGAAAYNQPSNVDPFAAITEDLQGRVEGIRKEEQRKKDNIDKANELIIQDIDPKGWDIDNRKIFYQKGLDLKKEAAILRTKGKNLSDPTDPEVMAFQRKQQEVLNQANSSAEQGKLFDPVYKEFIAKPDRYDQEKTLANIEKFKAMPFEERINVDPRTLLEKKFDKFAAVKPVKNFSDFTDVSPLKGTIIRPERIDAYLEEQIQSPDVQESIQMGIEQGAWKDVEGWRQAMTNHIKSLIPLKADKIEKPTNITVNTGSGSSIIENKQFNPTNKTFIPMVNANITTGAKAGGWKVNATIIESESLGPIPISVAPGNAFEVEGGKSNRSTPYLMSNPSLGVGLRHKNGMWLDENSPSITIKEDGKNKEITLEEAFKRGIIFYQPMLWGLAKTKNKDGEDEEVTIAVKATNVNAVESTKDANNQKALQDKINYFTKEAIALNKQRGVNTAKSGETKQDGTKQDEAKKGGAKEPLGYKEWKAANGNKGTIAQWDAYVATFKKN